MTTLNYLYLYIITVMILTGDRSFEVYMDGERTGLFFFIF